MNYQISRYNSGQIFRPFLRKLSLFQKKWSSWQKLITKMYYNQSFGHFLKLKFLRI